jgi:hypothetical protein
MRVQFSILGENQEKKTMERLAGLPPSIFANVVDNLYRVAINSKKEPELLLQHYYDHNIIDIDRHMSPTKQSQFRLTEQTINYIRSWFRLPFLDQSCSPLVNCKLEAHVTCIYTKMLDRNKHILIPIATRYKRRRTFVAAWPCYLLIHCDETLQTPDVTCTEIKSREIIIESVFDTDWPEIMAKYLSDIIDYLYSFMSNVLTTSSLLSSASLPVAIALTSLPTATSSTSLLTAISSPMEIPKRTRRTTTPTTTTTKSKPSIRKKPSSDKEKINIHMNEKIPLRLLKPCKPLIEKFRESKNNDIELECAVGEIAIGNEGREFVNVHEERSNPKSVQDNIGVDKHQEGIVIDKHQEGIGVGTSKDQEGIGVDTSKPHEAKFMSGVKREDFFKCLELAKTKYGSTMKSKKWQHTVDWYWKSCRGTVTEDSMTTGMIYMEKKPMGVVQYTLGDNRMIRFSAKSERILKKRPAGNPTAIRIKKRLTFLVGDRTKTELSFTIIKFYACKDPRKPCSQEIAIQEGTTHYEIEAEIPATVKNRKRIVFKTLANETLSSLLTILKSLYSSTDNCSLGLHSSFVK